MKQLVVGVLAHVDAGKTTLCEAMLYRSGDVRSLGRVDHGDAFLDTDVMERRRGITIFSKQAIVHDGDMTLTVIDTPGHVDFSADMERTLPVLDVAILVVGATDGVRGYTKTLWRLLSRYGIPTFVVVNKMDALDCDRDALLSRLRRELDEGCIDFMAGSAPERQEETAMLGERAMDEFVSDGFVTDDTLRAMVASRLLFPCFFVSALKLEGIGDLVDGLSAYATARPTGQGFGARVYKVSHDEHGGRLTWLKVTGGGLHVKDRLSGGGDVGPVWSQKIDQIRLYSGSKYDDCDGVPAGGVCAVTGLTRTFPGEGLGSECDLGSPSSQPVMTYAVLPRNADSHRTLDALRILEDEDPLLYVQWDEELREVRMQLMGAVQLEVVEQMMHDRFGVDVGFGPGSILYRETITAPVEGVGHFEPLRHYAEVHLLLEPTGVGTGLSFASRCSEEMLAKNWQRLVLTHLREHEHRGALTGSPITDMRITLLAGRAHVKHTEGGDFRQATYRAVRQGLMKATSMVLEPWYRFRLEVPDNALGRAMSDIQRMGGEFEPAELVGRRNGPGERPGGAFGGGRRDSNGPLDDGHAEDGYSGGSGVAVLTGRAPAEGMRDYPMEVSVYSHGQGNLSCTFDGYRRCHDESAVIDAARYDPESDVKEPPDSVFCAHGSGYTVAWNRVEDFMHVRS